MTWKPGQLIGVLGGGQLGRMLALAGYPLGLRFRFFDPEESCPAAQLGSCVAGDFTDLGALRRFTPDLSIVTYEFENIPTALLDSLEGRVPIYPSREALSLSQDRLLEKQFFQRVGIAVPRFVGVSTRAELDAAAGEIGFPSILKSRRFGYDGKGQAKVTSLDDAVAAWQQMQNRPCILEQIVPFEEEISIIAVRGIGGESAFYPICHNFHRDGILRSTWVDPTNEEETMAVGTAKAAVERILEELNYVGVLALELFVRSIQVFGNEMAPRVHNSGHWTIDGAPCSQFENHLRAILGHPLGQTHGERPCGMVNIIGDLPDLTELLRMPDTFVHLYDKEPRPGRKLGHVNVLAPTLEELKAKMSAVSAIVDPG